MNDYREGGQYSYDPYSPRQYERPPRRGGAGRVLAMLLAVVLLSGITTFGVQSALNAKSQADLDARLTRFEEQARSTEDSIAALTASVARAVNSSEGVDPQASAMPLVSGQAMTISDIAQNVRPSIVGVQVIGQVRRRFGQSPGDSTLSEGSGVIMSEDGYIMTNNHVIEYADQVEGATIKIILSDGREFGAALVGRDASTDLAVLKVDGTGLPAATMGTSSALRVGDTAVAIGNPMGQEFAGSVTSGIISAVDRSIEVQDGITLEVIQTDAAINPGNSGGALLNDRGEVIGINTVKISSTGVEGLGFAIPIDSALPILNDLRVNGKVSGRTAIGIENYTVVDEMSARIYGYPLGVYFERVSEGGAAEKAGLLAGDIITELDGKQIRSINDINDVKAQHKVGDTVSIKVMRYNEAQRNYEEIALTITLQEA